MRGILWRWLFFFGAIFWMSLCLADYHQKYLQVHFKQSLKNMDIRIEPPAPPFYQIVPQQRKLHPPTPALTFWKFLSIVFSVSAIVIIKRLSTFRKKGLPVSSCSDLDLIRSPYGSFITRVPPINNNLPIYHQEFQVARLETGFSSGDTRPPALIGVKIVQKKLEDLENNIATLKQRISNNSTCNPASSTSESAKKPIEPKLGANQSYFGPLTSNTESSSLSSSLLQPSEIKTRKAILHNHSKPLTPVSSKLEDTTCDLNPEEPSSSAPEKRSTPERSSRKSGTNRNVFMSLKELSDSMSGNNYPPKIEQTNENMDKDESITIPNSSATFGSSDKSKPVFSRKPDKEPKCQLFDNKTHPVSKTNSTCPSISSRKSHEGSTKSFLGDGTITDTNSTTSTLATIRKKRFLKSIKNRKKNLLDLSSISTGVANYLAPRFPRLKDDRCGSYAAINRKRAHAMNESRRRLKIPGCEQISASSSNASTDSIDKFVAKIMKPDSDAVIVKNSSDELSITSTSISSLTASSSTFISGGNPKVDSTSNSVRSIQSIMPLRSVSSTFSSPGNSRDMPAGAEPLSSRESLVEKSVSCFGNNPAIHSLAMSYLQTLERKKSESKEKMNDSASDFSITTKSVLERYKAKAMDSSAASSRQNILADKYWLLHW